jgi:hypothetical protein
VTNGRVGIMNAIERIRRSLTVCVLGLISCGIAQSSHAYCVRQDPIVQAWSYWFPDVHIPVYVARGDDNSVANIGHTPEEVARIVREVVARHNETVAVPKLRFAGFTDSPWSELSDAPYEDLDSGITIMSYKCEDLDMMSEGNLCSALSQENHACGNVRGDGMLSTRGWVILVPAGCDTIPTYDDKWTLGVIPISPMSCCTKSGIHLVCSTRS